MNCYRLLLLAAVFGGAALPVQAQILIAPPGYGYSGYGYSRYGSSGGVRIGFIGSPYAPFGYSSTRITIVTVVQPSFVPVRRSRLSSLPPNEPPDELPDIPVARIRRPPKEVPPPKVEPKKPDPVDEHARQVRLGKQAFEAEEYGRAAQRFREANRLLPDEPLPYFLLAQTLIALGKYHEALDAILAGMAKQPDWPAARFRPIDLYGGGAAEYPEHLLRLDDALKKHPTDPVLLFLNGYQVWFAGRREAAVPLFRQARDRLADKPGVEALRAACERFLKS
jgi:Tetratricopeptide repeat